MTGAWNTLVTAAKLFADIRVGFALGALGVYAAAILIVGFRWQAILRALGRSVALSETLLAYLASVFATNVTPARTLGGDASRVAIIRSRTGIPLSVAAASVLYDRATELPALALLGLLAMPVLKPSIRVIAVVLALFVAVIGIGPIRRAIARRIEAWHHTLVGVHVERSRFPAPFICSMLVWLQDITRIMLGAAAFGVHLSPSQAATLSVLRLAAGLIPIPGGVGVVEGGMIAGLVWFGIPTQTATAITILDRAIMYGCGTAAGAVAIMLLGGRQVLSRRDRLGVAAEQSCSSA